MSVLDEQVKLLARCRKRLASAKAKFKAHKEQVQASQEWQDLYHVQTMAKEAEANVDTAVREIAIAEYKRTVAAGEPDSRPHPAVDIKKRAVIMYDRAAITSWALVHLPQALTLDIGVFESYAKAVRDTIPVPGVTFGVEPTAAIARDLSKYAEQESDEI